MRSSAAHNAYTEGNPFGERKVVLPRSFLSPRGSTGHRSFSPTVELVNRARSQYDSKWEARLQASGAEP